MRSHYGGEGFDKGLLPILALLILGLEVAAIVIDFDLGSGSPVGAGHKSFQESIASLGVLKIGHFIRKKHRAVTCRWPFRIERAFDLEAGDFDSRTFVILGADLSFVDFALADGLSDGGGGFAEPIEKADPGIGSFFQPHNGLVVFEIFVFEVEGFDEL